jgi:hypothetical protein
MFFLFAMIELFVMTNISVIWKNDVITMELNENVNDYKFLPEAELWIDNQLVNDEHMFYERGVEHTFFSVITGKTVRDYHIKYRVHFPSYQIVETKTIIFKVVDLEPPIVHHIPSFKIPVGSKLPNLKEGLLYSDNYNQVNDCLVNVISHQVITNKLGIYPIYYQISDQSNNKVEVIGYLEVYDHLPPEILLKKEIIIAFGKSFEWSDFLTFKDNYDLVIDKIFDDSEVNYNRLGQYPLKIIATDQSGLVETLLTFLTIVDDEAPKIILKSNPKPLSVNQMLTLQNLRSFIIQVEDNYDNVFIEDVEISHDIEMDTLGQYKVYYTLSDQSNNIRTVILNVQVKDLDPPMIQINAPLVFDVFDLFPNWMDYIEVYDNYNEVHDIQIKYTTKINMNITGFYSLTIEAIDQSKNKNVMITTVQVIDREPPEIEQMHEIIITDFSETTLTNYFTLTDNYDETASLKIEIDDSKVYYHSVGVYPFTIKVIDQSDNISERISEVYVIDIIPPVIILKQQQLVLQMGSINFVPEHYILVAYDGHDDLRIEDVTIENNVDLNTIGVYQVKYRLIDLSYNETVVELSVFVDIMHSPIVKSDELIVNLNENVDLLNNLYVFSETETYQILFFPKIVDTSTAGTKVIQGVVIDERGNYTHFERRIIVLETPSTIEIQSYIPLMFLNFMGLSICYILWKKKRLL